MFVEILVAKGKKQAGSPRWNAGKALYHRALTRA